MNYYPFHMGDYAAHTAHLELLEDLAYRRMLDAYYLREEPLPSDSAAVARLIRMRQNIGEVEAVLEEFFQQTDDGRWFHSRCDAEIERMQDKQAKARASASASVSARKAKVQPTLTERSTDAQRSFNERSTNAERTLNDRSTGVELPTPTPTPTPTKPNGLGESAARPARKCPDSFAVDDSMQGWAAKEAPLVNVETATAMFRDHTFKTAISDWSGAWRNWIRKDQQFLTERQRPPPRRVPAPEKFAEVCYGPGGSL